MAHGDYDCCAICDSKLSYNPYDSITKMEICSSCSMELRDLGLIILDVEDLIKWLKKADKKDIENFIEKTSYNKCYYRNEVDSLIEQRIKS